MASDETFEKMVERAGQQHSRADGPCESCVRSGARAMARRAVEISRQRLFNGPTSTEYEAGYNAACGHIITDVAAFAGIEVDNG